MLWFALPLALAGLFAAAGMIIFTRYEVSFAVVLAMLLPAGLIELGVFFIAPADVGAPRFLVLTSAGVALLAGIGGVIGTARSLAGKPLRRRTTSVVTYE